MLLLLLLRIPFSSVTIVRDRIITPITPIVVVLVVIVVVVAVSMTMKMWLEDSKSMSIPPPHGTRIYVCHQQKKYHILTHNPKPYSIVPLNVSQIALKFLLVVILVLMINPLLHLLLPPTTMHTISTLISVEVVEVHSPKHIHPIPSPIHPNNRHNMPPSYDTSHPHCNWMTTPPQLHVHSSIWIVPAIPRICIPILHQALKPQWETIPC
mmetsp:Transcript_6448/g.9367  ORF Transcript_6448/g.9367 Transcript_6448/m.9367 type:complete len:210 (+) Transcript_6448:890-1519(+)